MARLPNADRAIVLRAKIVDYLLSPTHPGGRAKARLLVSFGFRSDNWQVLRDAIMAHAMANEITTLLRTPFGAKYEIDGPLPAPDGRAPLVRVVWFIQANEDVPRLVTLVPRGIKGP